MLMKKKTQHTQINISLFLQHRSFDVLIHAVSILLLLLLSRFSPTSSFGLFSFLFCSFFFFFRPCSICACVTTSSKLSSSTLTDSSTIGGEKEQEREDVVRVTLACFLLLFLIDVERVYSFHVLFFSMCTRI